MELLNFEGHSVLDSKDVAEMIGKDHKHLMRDIRSYINDLEESPKLDSRQFFIQSTYISKQGKVLPSYLLTKQGCEFVANKMTGKKGNQFTAQYVTLFNQMKEKSTTFNIPKTLPEALRLAADQAEQLEKQRPKVEYFDSQMKNPGLMSATEIAKCYGWSAITLNLELHKRKVIYRQGKHWVLYQKYSKKGYASFESYSYENKVKNTLKWTQRGKKFIYDLLAKDHIYPIIEQLSLIEE